MGPRCHATRQGCRGPGQSSSTQRLAQRPGGDIVQNHLYHSINYSSDHILILYCRLFTFKDYCRKVFYQPRSGGQVLLRLFFSSSFCFGVTFCFCFLQWPCFSACPADIYKARFLGTVSIQKALQGCKNETREPVALQANQFYNEQME